MKLRLSLVSLFAVFLSCTCTQQVSAYCACPMEFGRCQAWQKFPVVFVGRVVRVNHYQRKLSFIGPDGKTHTAYVPYTDFYLSVERAFKGQARGTVVVTTEGDRFDCDYGLADGGTYLLYARRAGNAIQVDECSTKPLRQARAELELLERFEPGQVKGTLSECVQPQLGMPRANPGFLPPAEDPF